MLPEGQAVLEELFDYCRKGIDGISAKPSTNCLSLIGAISEALESAEHCRTGDSDCEREITAATDAIRKLLGEGCRDEGVETAAAEGSVENREAAVWNANAGLDSPLENAVVGVGDAGDYMPENPDMELLGEFVTECADFG